MAYRQYAHPPAIGPSPSDRVMADNLRLTAHRSVASPVEWKDPRALIDLAERANACAAQQSIATTFLRDEAVQLERANFFEARSSTEQRSISGRILRVSSRFIVCEVLDLHHILPCGWTADDASVRLAHHEAYRGAARLSNVVNTGQTLICEWALQDVWRAAPEQNVLAPFFERMLILGRISEVFKAGVAQVASVLEEARQCLDRIEVTIQPRPGPDRDEWLRAALPELQRELFPAFDQVFAKFEEASQTILPALDAEYHSLVRHRMLPLIMCAPFVHHVYAKPLGFAGDYGALQKLLGDPFEGQTLFARLLNAWLVLSPAGDAYRHRVTLLVNELRSHATSCRQRGRIMRVLSVGCGAATEVERFLTNADPSDCAEFTLVDFNEATLAFAKQRLDNARQKTGRQAEVSLIQSTIQKVVRDESKMRRKGLQILGPVARAAGYDFVYCTGLFDYFSDRVCRRLTDAMLGMLAPGGKLIVCNFTPKNPVRQFMKYVVDWNLVHRTPEQLCSLVASDAFIELRESPGGTESYVIATR